MKEESKERGREEGERERVMRSIKSAEWIRPQCRRKKESPSLELASEWKLKNAEERNKRTLSLKEDAELRSERDEIAAEEEDEDRYERKSRTGEIERQKKKDGGRTREKERKKER